MDCRTLLAVVVLVALALLLPAAGVQTKRAKVESRRQAVFRRKVHRVQEVLHLRMPQLRRAIWDELGLVPQQPLTEDLADAARELLATEADYLAAEDDFAAAALHDYARSSLVPALSFQPVAEPELPAHFLPAQWGGSSFQQRPAEMQTLESQETLLQRNAQGQLVKTMRRCRGNRCVTMEEVQQPQMEPGALYLDNRRGLQLAKQMLEEKEQAEEEALTEAAEEEGQEEEQEEQEEEEQQEEEEEEQQEEQVDEGEEGQEEEEEEEEEDQDKVEEEAYPVEEAADEEASPTDIMDDATTSAADMVGPAVRVVARNMAKELKRAMQDFGLPPLDHIAGKMMNSTFSQEVAKSISSGSNVTEGAGEAFKAGFGKLFKDLLGNLSPGNLSNISNTMGSALAGSESVSSVSTVENGHVVHRVRRCSQGKCTTTVEEGEDSGFAPFGGLTTDEMMDSAFVR